MKTGKTLFADSVSGDATLGAVSSFYGQDKSESHARERLSILLAQRVGVACSFIFWNISKTARMNHENCSRQINAF